MLTQSCHGTPVRPSPRNGDDDAGVGGEHGASEHAPPSLTTSSSGSRQD